MKQLTILVPNGHHNLSSVVGSYEVFSKANAYYQSLGRKPVFKISLAGTVRTVKLYDSLFEVKPSTDIAAIDSTDLIIIPAVLPDFHQSIKQVDRLTAWLKDMHRQGAAVASICTGAFLLASTGMLENRSCSTHWMAADAFRKMFPSVHLGTDKLITDEDGVYTNGGAFSFLNLLLYLVEKYYDRQTAIYCSKIFQVDIDRQSQSPFTIFSTQKKHNDEVVKKAQVHMENRLGEKISMKDLSSRFNVSRRNFDRRFIKATGNTPIEYLQRAKIEAAKKALETSRKNVNEVMYDAGYSDVKAFREVFRKITGMSPLDYRSKYNKEAAI
ncbi:MAG TPA: helix-turn-helix domain-containing protein [Cyclobacteriaceae bacterium]|nr:helix-turn-helix domain-containing protein [Cyclobacteriaceae bacterium]